jgi:hypothetical protein
MQELGQTFKSLQQQKLAIYLNKGRFVMSYICRKAAKKCAVFPVCRIRCKIVPGVIPFGLSWSEVAFWCALLM